MVLIILGDDLISDLFKSDFLTVDYIRTISVRTRNQTEWAIHRVLEPTVSESRPAIIHHSESKGLGFKNVGRFM